MKDSSTWRNALVGFFHLFILHITVGKPSIKVKKKCFVWHCECQNVKKTLQGSNPSLVKVFIYHCKACKTTQTKFFCGVCWGLYLLKVFHWEVNLMQTLLEWMETCFLQCFFPVFFQKETCFIDLKCTFVPRHSARCANTSVSKFANDATIESHRCLNLTLAVHVTPESWDLVKSSPCPRGWYATGGCPQEELSVP